MSVPVELLRLRSATTVYLDILADVEEWAQAAADVNRIIRPGFAVQLDRLRDQLTTAMLPDETGTPAGIGRVLAEMLGEGSPGVGWRPVSSLSCPSRSSSLRRFRR